MKEFVLCQNIRYLCMMAGRGAGKTHAIKSRMILLCTKYPGFKYSYIGPTKETSQEILDELGYDHDFQKFVKSYSSRGNPAYRLKNGSTMIFYDFQRPMNRRGKNPHEIALDESQTDCFTKNNINEVIVPMLRVPSPAGGTGTLVMAGQFRGEDWRKTDFYNRGLPTLENGDQNPTYDPREYRSWRIPASDGYSYKVPGGPERYELERQRYEMSGERRKFEQEYECLPTSNDNAVWRPEMIDQISTKRHTIIKACSLDEIWRGGPTVVGSDIAGPGVHADHCADCVTNSRGEIVYAERQPRSISYAQSAERTMSIALHFKAQTVVLDATGGGRPGQSREEHSDVIKIYQAAAERHKNNISLRLFYFGGQKVRLVTNIEVALQQQTMGIAAGCLDLLKEMKAFEVLPQKKKSFFLEYGSPKGLHDDIVSAMLLSWEGYHQLRATEWQQYGSIGTAFGASGNGFRAS